MDKYIVHADMDAFFAAVEQRNNPRLRGKPVIIGADPKGGQGRGVVSTASYQARAFGIASAMPISQAYQRCPQGIYLRPDMAGYSRVSKQVYAIFYQFSPFVEPVGIDEAFLDISGSFHIFGTPEKTCRMLKDKIKKDLGLTVSVGLAPIKMAAKIASDLNKPDGFYQVKKDRLLDFLRPLDIGKLWGIGKKTKKRLNSMGVDDIGQLGECKKEVLEERLGKAGLHFWQLAKGIDPREVKPAGEAKSIGNEVTFAQDTADLALIEPALSRLCEEVSCRLRASGLRARNVCLKIRLDNFLTYTRSMRLINATNFYDTIYKIAKKLYHSLGFEGKKIRLAGVKTENFVSSGSRDTIFAEFAAQRKEKKDAAVARIRAEFGRDSIRRGGSL